MIGIPEHSRSKTIPAQIYLNDSERIAWLTNAHTPHYGGFILGKKIDGKWYWQVLALKSRGHYPELFIAAAGLYRFLHHEGLISGCHFRYMV